MESTTNVHTSHPVWTHDVTNTTTNGTMTTTVTPPVPEMHHDLMWLVPTLFGMFFFLIGMAWFLFYCIKKCEIATMAFCYRKFGLCPPDERSKMFYNSLGEDNETDSDTLYLKDVQSPTRYRDSASEDDSGPTL
ncbi:uncharacterized protein LOC117330514 isoform X2 [Pecten maximus]|uniref:uncharacterized protein LOC117330514 isoform X2 n=1 Tax=Pecten maximus TaxID=6579 RepID=UPI0014582E37|nr:uncharacterized protein LOC117330514 isoform X2 [Pecten maximus]